MDTIDTAHVVNGNQFGDGIVIARTTQSAVGFPLALWRGG